MKKCKFCEDYKRIVLQPVMNKDKGLFAIEFDDYDEEPLLDIIHKPHGDVFLESTICN